MSQVLYRKFRPQKFEEIVGQEHIVQTLSNQLKNGSLAHAYLFTGPRGVGKTSVARILARAANCLSPLGIEPDNVCAICGEMIEGRSLDLTEIDAASHTGVDNIREIIDHLPVPPTNSKYRTYIIDEVHMLSRGAFNALLKTLEEPPAHALFILATTEIHKIPATIISRTQRFDFRKLTDLQIEEHLVKTAEKEGIKLDGEIIASIAQSVDGGLRDALVLLEKASHLSAKADADGIQKLLGITPVRFRQEFLQLIKTGKVSEAAEFLKRLAVDGYNFEQFSRDFLEYVRNQMSESMDKSLAIIAKAFLLAHQQLKYSPVPELPLMVAAISAVEEIEGKKEPIVPKAVNNLKENISRSVPTVPYVETTSSGHIDFKIVQERWMEILSRVRQYNQSLLSALKLAEPTGSINGSVTIAFPYKFHAETVSAAKNRLVIERVFEELFNQRITVKCIAKKDLPDEPQVTVAQIHQPQTDQPTNDLLKSAMEVLGGELVN